MRLISDLSTAKPVEVGGAFEASTRRLREAVAILEAIDEGNLLADLSGGEEGSRQQCAVSLLSLLERELRAIVACQESQLGRFPYCNDAFEHGVA
jgi:hypothetical protein